jgi:transcriptional regulator with XRE-family HTH domain
MVKRQTKSVKIPSAIDKKIADRVRDARVEAGISQADMGRAIGGLSFQQIQKYENGINRISAGRLWQIATCLKVPIGKFYEGL